MKWSDLTGAIICGGKSKRFGSDKRLFKYKGKTLLDVSFQKLNQICNETICVFRELPPLPLKDYPHIFDEGGIEGPMAGILAALKYTSRPYVFVLPCDMPNISINFLKHFASLKEPDKVVVFYTTRPEPLIGIYPKIFYEELKTFSASKKPSLKSFLLQLPVEKKGFINLLDIGYKTVDLRGFENINSPKDLYR